MHMQHHRKSEEKPLKHVWIAHFSGIRQPGHFFVKFWTIKNAPCHSTMNDNEGNNCEGGLNNW